MHIIELYNLYNYLLQFIDYVINIFSNVVVCTDLLGKDLHRQICVHIYSGDIREAYVV